MFQQVDYKDINIDYNVNGNYVVNVVSTSVGEVWSVIDYYSSTNSLDQGVSTSVGEVWSVIDYFSSTNPLS
jgi:hypothetical protein